MRRWRQQLHRFTFSMENLVVVFLLMLAALLVVPLPWNRTAPEAEYGKQLLQQRVSAVVARASEEGNVYTITLAPQSGKIVVQRWDTGIDAGEPQGKLVRELSQPLPKGIVIAHTTLVNHVVAISESGVILSQGTATIRARDGSRTVLDIRAAE